MTTLTNPLGIITATNTYDALDKVDTQTVPRQSGIPATYNFYFSGYRNVEQDPDGNQIIYYFNSKGDHVANENALGNMTRKVFDGQNHVVKTIDPLGNETDFLYNKDYNLDKITNALLKETTFVYDTQFRLTDNIDPLSHTQHFDYDIKHHLEKTTIYPENGKEIYNSSTYYATTGFLNTSTDGRGAVTTFAAYDLGIPETISTNTHPAITYDYDTIGQIKSLTDQENALTAFNVYNHRGLLTEKTDPLIKKTFFTYHDDGKLNTLKDRNNDTTTFIYTPSGKIDTITYQDTSTVSFVYDQLDNLTAMNDTTGTTSYGYDSVNRIEQLTDSNGFVVSYQYDDAGNLGQITYPGTGKTVTYTYDDSTFGFNKYGT
jgi:YD repeat-containing protein